MERNEMVLEVLLVYLLAIKVSKKFNVSWMKFKLSLLRLFN